MSGRRQRRLFKPAILLFTIIIFLFSGCSADGGAAADTISPTEMGNEPDVVVWKVPYEEYADIWQEPLCRLLEEKGVPYTVRVEAYGSIEEDPEESAADILAGIRDNGVQADVITVPPMSFGVDSEFEGEFAFAYEFPYQEAVSKGLLLPLDDYLASDNGSALTAAIHARDLARSKIDGSVYGLSQNIRMINATAYNKEYLEKYNIDASGLSSDIFDNQEILELVQDGEDGAFAPYIYNADLLSMSGNWVVSPSSILTYTSDGQFVNGVETEEFGNLLAALKELTDRDLAAAPAGGYDDIFAVYTTAYTDEVFETTYTYTNSGDEEVEIEVVVIPNLDTPQISPNWGDAAGGIASWSENQENALHFLTLLYTDPDIANLIQYGIQGEDYVLTEGKAEYSNSLLWIFGEKFTNPLLTYSAGDMADDKRTYLDTYYEACEAYIPDGFRFDISSVEEEINATNAVYESSLVQSLLFLQTDDIDGARVEIGGALKAAGIETIIEEAQRQLEEWENDG